MSEDNGGGGRKARFKRFHASVGNADYGPDFIDAQIRVMADPDRDMAERCLAWSKFRAWTNHSRYAIRLNQVTEDGHTVVVEEALTQKDCALDLAWLESGGRPEWLDARRPVFEVEAVRHGIRPCGNSVVSRGFQFNESAGTIASGEPTRERYQNGRKIEPVVSPSGGVAKVAYSWEFRHFMEEAKVAYPQEFHEREVARSEVKRLNEFFLSKYKEWKQRRTPKTTDDRSYNPSINFMNSPSSGSVVVPEKPEDTTATATALEAETPNRVEADLSSAVTLPAEGTTRTATAAATARAKEPEPEVQQVYKALQQIPRCNPSLHDARCMIDRCRKADPLASIEGIIGAIQQKGPGTTRKENPMGWLLTFVPQCDFPASPAQSKFTPGSTKYRRI